MAVAVYTGARCREVKIRVDVWNLPVEQNKE